MIRCDYSLKSKSSSGILRKDTTLVWFVRGPCKRTSMPSQAHYYYLLSNLGSAVMTEAVSCRLLERSNHRSTVELEQDETRSASQLTATHPPKTSRTSKPGRGMKVTATFGHWVIISRHVCRCEASAKNRKITKTMHRKLPGLPPKPAFPRFLGQ
jgi:hypothetical protein